MRRKSVVVTATVLIVGVLIPADIVAAIDYKLWVNIKIFKTDKHIKKYNIKNYGQNRF